VDSEGFKVMTSAAPIGTRNNYLPGHNVYLTRDLSITGASVVAYEDDKALLGCFQQQLRDGQLYAMINDDINRKTTGLGAPLFPDELAASLSKAQGNFIMPTDTNAPDFAWGDEENMVVAAKHGDELFFTNMVWRGNLSINKVAMVFTISSTTAARAEVQLDDLRFVPSGRTETGKGDVDSFANKNPPDNKTYPNAEKDNRYPVALRPDLKEEPPKNNDGGRGTGYTLCYGHWLVGMNANHTTGPYTMKLPAGFTSGTDLVSGKSLTAPVVIAKGTTVVFHLPNPTSIKTNP